MSATDRIMLLLKRVDESTIDEIVLITDLAEPTVRQALNMLYREGRIELRGGDGRKGHPRRFALSQERRLTVENDRGESDKPPTVNGGYPMPLTFKVNDDIDLVVTPPPLPQLPHQDRLVGWLCEAFPGVSVAAAKNLLSRLREQNIGDVVIDECIGKAKETGAQSIAYVEKVAQDWMRQRDPTWRPYIDQREVKALRDALKELHP